MMNLIDATPGLETAYTKYQEFNCDPIMREYAFAREKTERDHRGQINSALRRGRREGVTEGRAEGAFQAKHQILLTFLTSFYTEQFTAADRERLLQINDPQKLDVILQMSLNKASYDELVKMF